ncbi:MAG: hypothetical protein MI739_00155, partial [Bacteroidales bacterium]|nr:hypothetical protein [Bacteroidales bacterium]
MTQFNHYIKLVCSFIILTFIVSIYNSCTNYNQTNKQFSGADSRKLLPLNELSKQKRYESISDAIKNPCEVYKLILFNQKLDVLPKEIIKLRNLNSLELSWNKLNSLPNNISKLKNIQSLYLNKNDFDRFPNQILYLNNLKRLNLSENNLGELPEK